MFRARQKVVPSTAFPVKYDVLRINESGKSYYEMVDQSLVVLPDVSTTDIKSLLEAGINPERVDTRILAPREIVTDLSVDEQVEINNQDKIKENK